MSNNLRECPACGAEALGYSKDELEKQGWCWHLLPNGGGYFIMCEDCEVAAEARRRPVYTPPPNDYCAHCTRPTTIVNAEHAVVGTPFRRSLPTVLCEDCDRYPALLRPRTEYEPGLLYPLEEDLA